MPPIVKLYRRSIITALLLIIILGAGGFVFRGELRRLFDFRKIAEQANLPEEKTIEEVQKQNDESANKNENVNEAENTNSEIADGENTDNSKREVLGTETKKKPLPAEMNLKVPFTSQAPNGNWNLPYQEACEETSAIMAHYFYQKKTLTAETADREILKLVEFQNKNYGFYKDTTAAEVARFIKDDWKYESVRVLPATIDGIKQELAAGRPVLAPAAGRLLGNPNFHQPGPLYHMLLIKGYTKDGRFITNDPGTRKGANYVYDQKVLMNAIHDWNGGDVNNGKKMMIVIDQNK